jgi:transcriptional regulator with XRE-family HTH domain
MRTMSEDEFGVQVRQARELAGWNQQRLAVEAGVSRETVVRVEGGRRPERETERALREALDRGLTRKVNDVSTAGFRTNPTSLPSHRLETAVEVSRRGLLRIAAVGTASLAGMTVDTERLLHRSLDEELIRNWQERVKNLAAARSLQPPRELLPEIETFLLTLERRVQEGSGSDPLRKRLLSITASTSAVAAWVSLMAERRPETRAYLDQGEALAREIGDSDLLILLLMLRADHLSAVLAGGEGGYPEQARRCLDEAMSLASPSTPLPIAVPAYLRAAEEAAFIGREDETLRLLDQGGELVERSRIREHPLRHAWQETGVAAHSGSAFQLLGRAREAIEALGPIKSPFPCHRPILAADLAAAHAQAGEIEEACRLLTEALVEAIGHGHIEAAGRIQGVRRRCLADRGDEQAVRDLDEVIASIL